MKCRLVPNLLAFGFALVDRTPTEFGTLFPAKRPKTPTSSYAEPVGGANGDLDLLE